MQIFSYIHRGSIWTLSLTSKEIHWAASSVTVSIITGSILGWPVKQCLTEAHCLLQKLCFFHSVLRSSCVVTVMAAAHSSGALPCCKPPKVCSPPAVMLVGWDTHMQGVLKRAWAWISLSCTSYSLTHSRSQLVCRGYSIRTTYIMQFCMPRFALLCVKGQ